MQLQLEGKLELKVSFVLNCCFSCLNEGFFLDELFLGQQSRGRSKECWQFRLWFLGLLSANIFSSTFFTRELILLRAGDLPIGESLSHSVVSDSEISWAVDCKSPLLMEFSRQEHCCGWPFPSPGDFPDPGIEHRFPALQPDSLLSEPPGKPLRAANLPILDSSPMCDQP